MTGIGGEGGGGGFRYEYVTIRLPGRLLPFSKTVARSFFVNFKKSKFFKAKLFNSNHP